MWTFTGCKLFTVITDTMTIRNVIFNKHKNNPSKLNKAMLLPFIILQSTSPKIKPAIYVISPNKHTNGSAKTCSIFRSQIRQNSRKRHCRIYSPGLLCVSGPTTPVSLPGSFRQGNLTISSCERLPSAVTNFKRMFIYHREK